MNNITRQASLGDNEARETLYKIFHENYQEEFDCWTRNLYSTRHWMDVEDMKQDIYMESVEFHIENHKYYDLGIPDDYLMKKSIRQTISKYVKKQTSIMDKPHICVEQPKGGGCKRFITQTRTFDSDNTADFACIKFAKNGNDRIGERSLPLKEKVPDPNIKDPLDKVIYDEFVELMLEKIVDYQFDYSYDLRKIFILLLEGENSTNICRIMGMNLSKHLNNAIRDLKNLKTNVFLPLALSIIDDAIYTDQYWDCLTKKAKSLFFSQKNT